jgi:adenosylcobyric acid synthase
MSADGLVAGSYIHGLLGEAAQRAAWLARIGIDAQGPDHDAAVDAALDELAAGLEAHLDMDAIVAIARAGV